MKIKEAILALRKMFMVETLEVQPEINYGEVEEKCMAVSQENGLEGREVSTIFKEEFTRKWLGNSWPNEWHETAKNKSGTISVIYESGDGVEAEIYGESVVVTHGPSPYKIQPV